MPTTADPWREGPPPLAARRSAALAPARQTGRPGAERWDLLVQATEGFLWVQHRAVHAARPGPELTQRAAFLFADGSEKPVVWSHQRSLLAPHDGHEPTLTIARAVCPTAPGWDLRLVPGGRSPLRAGPGATWVLPTVRAYGQGANHAVAAAPATLHRAVEGPSRTLFLGEGPDGLLLVSSAGPRAEILLDRDGHQRVGGARAVASPRGTVLHGTGRLRGLTISLVDGPAAGAIGWRDPDGAAGWTTAHSRAHALIPGLGARISGVLVRDTRHHPEVPVLLRSPGA